MLYNLQVKGSHRSDAQRLACKTSNKASHKTAEYRAKMKALKSNRIGKFDKQSGKLLEVYQDSDEACNKTKLAKSTLLGACNGSKKSAGGYIWHYLDENNNIITSYNYNSMTIYNKNQENVEDKNNLNKIGVH